MTAVLTAQNGLGTSPPAPTVRAADGDVSMAILLGTGTSPVQTAASGAAPAFYSLVKVKLYGWNGGDDGVFVSGATYAGPVASVVALNANALTLGTLAIVANDSAGNYTIGCTGAPAASQAAGTYIVGLSFTGPIE